MAGVSYSAFFRGFTVDYVNVLTGRCLSYLAEDEEFYCVSDALDLDEIREWAEGMAECGDADTRRFQEDFVDGPEVAVHVYPYDPESTPQEIVGEPGWCAARPIDILMAMKTCETLAA